MLRLDGEASRRITLSEEQVSMIGPEEIWAEAVRTLERDKPFALATVVNVRGSTPREVGAKMIVRDDGQFGTIGGGCGEAEVFRKARVLLEDGGEARLAEVDLTGDFDQQQIGTCGGIMDVFIDLWRPRADLEIARRLADAADHNRPAALLTVVDPGKGSSAGATPAAKVGERTLVDISRRATPLDGFAGLGAAAAEQLGERTADAVAALFEVGADGAVRPATRVEPSGAPRVFLDPITGAQRLIIVGAGHIAQPLAQLGSMLGFHVTVIDDRAAFANRERFPGADQIIVRPFAAAIEALELDRHCYLLSVTRGHAFDEEVLRTALKRRNGAFIGMIGSRRRVRATLERIAEDGVPASELDEVHAPLGVDLGAETPAEIAVSIIAEIVRERRTAVRDSFNLGVKLGQLRRPSS
jgi:xanthine dehydrogenase accessory factor